MCDWLCKYLAGDDVEAVVVEELVELLGRVPAVLVYGHILLHVLKTKLKTNNFCQLYGESFHAVIYMAR